MMRCTDSVWLTRTAMYTIHGTYGGYVFADCSSAKLQRQDLNLRPLGYDPSELPDCSTLRYFFCLFLFRHGREIIPWLLRRYLRPLLSSRIIREQELYPPYKDLRCFLPGPAVNLDRKRNRQESNLRLPTHLCSSSVAIHGSF